MVKSILEDDTYWIGLGGLGDHQIRNSLKKGEKVSKGPLRILAGLEVGVLENITKVLHSRVANTCQNVKINY
jgi:hypothetical protein